MKILPFFLSLAVTMPVWADTCKYQDADGHIIYSNITMKGVKKLACFGSDGSSNAGSAASRASQPTPSNFPKVDASIQKQRDDTRRKILQDELASEQAALEQAKKAYAEGESDPETFKTTIVGKDGKAQTVTHRNVAAYEDKMKKLQDDVDLHQKNIEMLQKELAGLR
jgi:predicted RNase H-like nuclease (RuvC/YqgF family)